MYDLCTQFGRADRERLGGRQDFGFQLSVPIPHGNEESTFSPALALV